MIAYYCYRLDQWKRKVGLHRLMQRCNRYTAPLSQRLAEADARMLAQQSRIDARLSNCVVDEVTRPAAPACCS